MLWSHPCHWFLLCLVHMFTSGFPIYSGIKKDAMSVPSILTHSSSSAQIQGFTWTDTLSFVAPLLLYQVVKLCSFFFSSQWSNHKLYVGRSGRELGSVYCMGRLPGTLTITYFKATWNDRWGSPPCRILPFFSGAALPSSSLSSWCLNTINTERVASF